ncbi:TetR/AcrR family transcriptional regulator [Vibrio lentus]|nr:TetR/AcrR family transcriptional regulator [Vibrio lentus]
MDKKQKQVIQAAIELSHTGEKRLSQQVCETAKVSKGLVFHHFQNKDDLLQDKCLFAWLKSLVKLVKKCVDQSV